MCKHLGTQQDPTRTWIRKGGLRMPPKRSSSKRPATKPAGYRSADSGKYVTKKHATSHPKTTVKETRRK